MEDLKKMLGITDERRDFYFKVENSVVDDEVFSNVYEAYLFVVLSRYCNNNQIAYPSLETLSKKCYCSKNTVLKCLKSLNEKGYIKRVQRYNEENKSYNTTVYAVKNIKNLVHHVNKGSAPDEQGVVHQMNKGSAPDEHKEEQLKEELLKKEKLKEVRESILKLKELLEFQFDNKLTATQVDKLLMLSIQYGVNPLEIYNNSDYLRGFVDKKPTWRMWTTNAETTIQKMKAGEYVNKDLKQDKQLDPKTEFFTKYKKSISVLEVAYNNNKLTGDQLVWAEEILKGEGRI